MLRQPRRRLMLAVLVLLGTLALLQHAVANRRPETATPMVQTTLTVTNEDDAGPGTLREAIFIANGLSQRARIEIRTARIALRTPLPPLVNRHGIVLEGASDTTEIEGNHLGTTPILDVQSPGSTIQRLHLRRAAGNAVLVRAPAVRLTEVVIGQSGTGVHATVEGHTLSIDGSHFDGNDYGIRIESDAPASTVQRNLFTRHQGAALWAVSGIAARADVRGVVIVDNRFEYDRLSIVLGNMPATVERNEIVGAEEVAIFVAGQGGTIRSNRVREGERVGILGASTEGAVIAENEVDHQKTVGIQLSSASGTVLTGNRSYSNGYGFIVVFGDARSPNLLSGNTALANTFDGFTVIGGAPIIRGNRALRNRAAGIRVLDYVPVNGVPIAAGPLLDANDLQGNAADTLFTGEYHSR